MEGAVNERSEPATERATEGSERTTSATEGSDPTTQSAEAEPASQSAPAAVVVAAPPGKTKRGWRRALLPGLAAALVLNLIGAALLYLDLRHEHQRSAARRAATVAATAYAVDLTTYDFGHLDG